MKKFRLIFVAVALVACNQQPTKEITDNRPTTERGLITQLIKANAIYKHQTNDIGKKEVSDSLKLKIADYLLKQPNATVDNWQATVNKIEVSQFADNVANVELIIPLHFDGSDEGAESDKITLQAKVRIDDPKFKETIKSLRPTNKVEVSGAFPKDKTGGIDFMSANSVEDYVFTNPEFDFEITSIKKIAQ